MRTYINVYTYWYIQVYTYVYIHVYTYVYIHVYTYIHIHLRLFLELTYIHKSRFQKIQSIRCIRAYVRLYLCMRVGQYHICTKSVWNSVRMLFSCLYARLYISMYFITCMYKNLYVHRCFCMCLCVIYDRSCV